MDDRQRQTLQKYMIFLNIVYVECQFFCNVLRDSNVICGLNKMLCVLT